MTLTDEQLAFLSRNRAAAMITVGADGYAKAVRVGVALVDGRLWSSGTRDRVRTARLRQDPRCTLFVFDSAYSYLSLETTVSVLDGPDAAAQNLRLFRIMQSRPTGPLSWFGGMLDDPAFLEAMAREDRLVYEFEVQRASGMIAD